jgi:hypothetical protein
MINTERGFGAGRLVTVLMMSSFAIALAGCGGESGSAAAGSATSSSGSGSTQPTTIADSAPTDTSGGSTGGSGSTGGTTGGSTTPTTPPPVAASSSTVALSWEAPTQNTNGTTITDLAGYKIHYGTASSNYTQTVAVKNAGLTRYVVDTLPTGTYYFAITAYNTQGMESALSGEITTRVN